MDTHAHIPQQVRTMMERGDVTAVEQLLLEEELYELLVSSDPPSKEALESYAIASRAVAMWLVAQNPTVARVEAYIDDVIIDAADAAAGLAAHGSPEVVEEWLTECLEENGYAASTKKFSEGILPFIEMALRRGAPIAEATLRALCSHLPEEALVEGGALDRLIATVKT